MQSLSEPATNGWLRKNPPPGGLVFRGRSHYAALPINSPALGMWSIFLGGLNRYGRRQAFLRCHEKVSGPGGEISRGRILGEIQLRPVGSRRALMDLYEQYSDDAWFLVEEAGWSPEEDEHASQEA